MTKLKGLPTAILGCVLFAAITGIAVSQEKGPKKSSGPCAGYNMPIIQPREGIEFKTPIIEPSGAVDYKLIVIDPCREVKTEMVRAVPTPTPAPKDAVSKPPFSLLPNPSAPSLQSPSEKLKQLALPGSGKKTERP